MTLIVIDPFGRGTQQFGRIFFYYFVD